MTARERIDAAIAARDTGGQGMTVYIVLEEDRGIGVTVSGVYPTEAQAQASCGGHKWIAEAMFDDSAIRAEARQLPRAMIDEFDAMRETYDTAEAIARRYGYSIKEE